MAPKGIQQFYYGKNLPARAVAIAHVTALEATPANLVDVASTPLRTGSLSIWKAGQGLAVNPDFTAFDYNQSVLITGDVVYLVQNQFFQITNQFASNQTPLYFYHDFAQAVSSARVLNLDGSPVTPAPQILMAGTRMYHDLPSSSPYMVRFMTPAGMVKTVLLHYSQVLPAGQAGDTAQKYVFTGGMINLASSTESYAIRFIAANGYQVLPPYQSPSYLPWFPRIRFSVQPPALEYPVQNFLPARPYVLGSWVPGKVLGPNLIEFERGQIYNDPNHLPDILVYDQNQVIKYALDGAGDGEPETHGTLYPWRRRQIADVDPFTARVQILPQLVTTDTVYGFYSYSEPDVLYTALDLNPITNPAIKNKVTVFYYRTDSDPRREIYHQVFDTAEPVPGLTNDPAPPVWTGMSPTPGTVFAEVMVGISFGVSTFNVSDARVRGGGLAPAYQAIPQADGFWDLGYLDGRPYPAGGALVVYLPSRILNTMTRVVIAAKLDAILPMGTMAVVRFYDPQGVESV